VKECESLQEHLSPPQNGLYRCRVVYTDETIDVSYHEYKKRDISSLKLVYDDTIEYPQKSTDRSHIDRLFAQKGNADDILIVKNSLVTDTSIANIAFYKNGVWHTPESPLLEGTTRERLLESGFLVRKDIRVEELESFTKTALLNAMIDFDIISDISYKH
jgi:4-amino-4-deoxychorismate lyase